MEAKVLYKRLLRVAQKLPSQPLRSKDMSQSLVAQIKRSFREPGEPAHGEQQLAALEAIVGNQIEASVGFL